MENNFNIINGFSTEKENHIKNKAFYKENDLDFNKHDFENFFKNLENSNNINYNKDETNSVESDNFDEFHNNSNNLNINENYNYKFNLNFQNFKNKKRNSYPIYLSGENHQSYPFILNNFKSSKSLINKNGDSNNNYFNNLKINNEANKIPFMKNSNFNKNLNDFNYIDGDLNNFNNYDSSGNSNYFHFQNYSRNHTEISQYPQFNNEIFEKQIPIYPQFQKTSNNQELQNNNDTFNNVIDYRRKSFNCIYKNNHNILSEDLFKLSPQKKFNKEPRRSFINSLDFFKINLMSGNHNQIDSQNNFSFNYPVNFNPDQKLNNNINPSFIKLSNNVPLNMVNFKNSNFNNFSNNILHPKINMYHFKNDCCQFSKSYDMEENNTPHHKFFHSNMPQNINNQNNTYNMIPNTPIFNHFHINNNNNPNLNLNSICNKKNKTKNKNKKINQFNINNNETENIEVNYLIENIQQFLIDQNGCRLLQKKIEEKNYDLINSFFEKIIKSSNLIEIINDQFGNYVIQKFLEVIFKDKYIMTTFFENINSKIFDISVNLYGTRVFQKALDLLDKNYQFIENDIINEIFKNLVLDYMMDLIIDTNGNHVFLKIIGIFPKSKNEFIFDQLLEKSKDIAKLKQGGTVFQKAFEHGSKTQIVFNII